VLIAAGGTAGHVVPALAVAAELSGRGAEVEFAGGDRIEARLVPEAGYPLHPFEVRGLERRLSPALAGSAWKAATAPVACRRIISQVKPDVVFGAGGYVSGPMLLAARASRLPGALLEVDAHMGMANRLAAPLVERVYLSFPIDGRTGGKYLVTGRPIPAEPADAGEPWEGDVLAFGGSLGATRLNTAVAPWAGGDLRVLHITGDREYEQYRTLDGDRYRVRAFLPGLRAALRGAALVVARAGGSIFEVAAAGKPSILIPSPNVTADHQTANARHLEAAGAAIVIPDAELTPERLDAEVRALLADPERMRRMGEAALAWAKPDAAAVIADDLLTLHRR